MQRLLPAALAAACLTAAVAGPLSACSPTENGAEKRAENASESEREILERIVRAEREVAFEGWKTIHSGRVGESRATRLRVRRDGNGSTLAEWSATKGGDVGEDTTRRRWVYRARHHWIDRPELLLTNYRVVEADGPTEVVAWREARTVRFVPRAEGRPTLEVLVDVETSLPLAETLRDREGVVRLTWQFETLSIGRPEEWPTAGEPERLDGASTEATAPDFAPLAVAHVPAGFEPVEERRAANGMLREYWSDGLAAFSIVQGPPCEQSPPDGELQRVSKRGRAAVVGRFGDVVVTVAGNLPLDELEAVAAGLRRVDAP